LGFFFRLREAFGVQALPNLPSAHPASGEKRRIKIAGFESATFLDPAIPPPAICFFPDVDPDFGYGNGHSNTSKGVANADPPNVTKDFWKSAYEAIRPGS
jgi:hypothetical protein